MSTKKTALISPSKKENQGEKARSSMRTARGPLVPFAAARSAATAIVPASSSTTTTTTALAVLGNDANPRPAKKAALRIDDTAFFEIGMAMIKCDPDLNKVSQKTALGRFHAHFGCSPTVAAQLWTLIDPYGEPLLDDNGKEVTNASPKHLLWGLMFLYCAASEKNHCTMASAGAPKRIDENTFRKWSWIMATAISYLDAIVVCVVAYIVLL